MATQAFNVGSVSLRSMPFWCVGNPLSDPFGGKVLNSIDSLETANILGWAAGAGLIECTRFHDDDLVPWDPPADGGKGREGTRCGEVANEPVHLPHKVAGVCAPP